MRIIESIAEMQQQADWWRREGAKIGLVPTMGFLHEGHLALVRASVGCCDHTVVSIFVNPTQFGPGEDFERYPRDTARDCAMLDTTGADLVFIPTAAEIYPAGYQTYVEVAEVTRLLCGKSRPVHFRGVTTVVAKLFNIVKPHMSIFGEKDYQQLVTIRTMVRDLNLDIEVAGHPLIREADGLAMSSRNAYLTPEQRRTALRLSQSLRAARSLVSSGETRGPVIMDKVIEVLQPGQDLRLDYAELCHSESLQAITDITAPTLLALAAYVGRARLIDNCLLTPRCSVLTDSSGCGPKGG